MKVMWYYSKSKNKVVNLYDVDPNHARNALMKVLEKLVDKEGVSLDKYLGLCQTIKGV